MSSSPKRISLRTRWFLVVCLVVGSSTLLSVSPSLADEEEEAPCPDGILGAIALGAHWIPQVGGEAADLIPFRPTSYLKESGQVPGPSTAWYEPNSTRTTHGGVSYDWVGARVKIRCFRLAGIEIYYPLQEDGVAVVSGGSSPSGPTEEVRGGGDTGDDGSGGGGGFVCYEVWLVWRDDSGAIVQEQHIADVCFNEE